MPRVVILIAALLVAGALAAPARATPAIEAVWAFNGGQVAIQQQPDSSFAGTVDGPTKFALCSHPVGEVMWTHIRAQPDGSYWGLHQWFFETEACQHNPLLGPTAWRVMSDKGGGHHLLVCFSYPGTSQPTITAGGVAEHVTYHCFQSALLAPVPADATRAVAFAKSVTLPTNRRCFSRRVFRIHLRDPKFDPIKDVVVTIRGRRAAVLHRGKHLSATIDLRGLPKGKFTVRIRLSTVLGHHFSGQRRYHTCVRRRSRR